jgi:mRNA interferase RelE/StbE
VPRYGILWSPKAEKTMVGLDRNVAERILRAVDRLADGPQSAANVKPLVGTALLRLRVGDWRIIFSRSDDRLLILIASVAHRREAYR